MPEKKKGSILGKKLHHFLYDTVFKIPTPTGKGEFPGAPLPSRKFGTKEVEMHEHRTFEYDGISVRPPRIAQSITNAAAHMVVPTNRGRVFDGLWKFFADTIKCGVKSGIAFTAGIVILAFGLNLWPVVMLIWMYSAYNLGEFFIQRSRYYTVRGRQTIVQGTSLPSERWSDPVGPLRGE